MQRLVDSAAILPNNFSKTIVAATSITKDNDAEIFGSLSQLTSDVKLCIDSSVGC